MSDIILIFGAYYLSFKMVEYYKPGKTSVNGHMNQTDRLKNHEKAWKRFPENIFANWYLSAPNTDNTA